MELLGHYSLYRRDTSCYELSFSVPENCLVNSKHENDVYLVYLHLREGDNQPSDVYVEHKLVCDAFEGEIIIDFIQQIADESGDYGDGTAVKPRVKIFVND